MIRSRVSVMLRAVRGMAPTRSIVKPWIAAISVSTRSLIGPLPP